jgi:hypothetical protein
MSEGLFSGGGHEATKAEMLLVRSEAMLPRRQPTHSAMIGLMLHNLQPNAINKNAQPELSQEIA